MSEKKKPVEPTTNDLLDDDATPAIIDTDCDVVDEAAPLPDREHVGTQPEPEEPKRTRYLEHILTPGEIDQMREEREQGDALAEKLTAELANVQLRAKDLKTEIEGIYLRGRKLSATIRAGVEWRDVECREERGLDWRRGESTFGKPGVVTVRCDTDEPIDWRPLSKEERQGVLFDEPATA